MKRPDSSVGAPVGSPGTTATSNSGLRAGLRKRVPKGLINRFRPAFIAWLTFMWVILMGELSWGNVIAGFLVGCAVVYLLPLPAMPLAGLSISWHRLIAYVFIFLWELAHASVSVAWLAIRPAPLPKTAIVNAPMRVSNEFVLALAVTLYNLQPGGAVTDIDIANRTLTLHILRANSDADIERELRNVARLESRLISIFERT